MRARLEQRIRRVFGVIVVIGMIALPQAVRAQVRQVSGHPVGVQVLALAGGGGYEAASLGALGVQQLRTWLRFSDEPVLNGTVMPPSGFKPRKLQVVDPAPVQWGGSNLQ